MYIWQVWLKLIKRFLLNEEFKIVITFSLCRSYIPLEISVALNLNKLVSLLPRILCVKTWLKLAKWFFKFCQCKFTVSPWSPLGKDVVLQLNKFESSSLWKYGLNWAQSSLEKDKKFTDTQTTDNRWSEKLTWAFILGELKPGESF